METTALAVLSRAAECSALLLIGYQLRSAQLFSATDAEVCGGPEECCQRVCYRNLLNNLALHQVNHKCICRLPKGWLDT